MAELVQFAPNALVAPGGVLPGQTRDQLAHAGGERWSTETPPLPEGGPLPADQLAVPAEQRLRPDGEAPPLSSGDAAAERRPQQSIPGPPLRPLGLPAQHTELVPEGQQLNGLRPRRRRADDSPGKEHAEDGVDPGEE